MCQSFLLLKKRPMTANSSKRAEMGETPTSPTPTQSKISEHDDVKMPRKHAHTLNHHQKHRLCAEQEYHFYRQSISLVAKTSPIFHMYKISWAFRHSDPFKGSPCSHSQSVSCFVGITSSCSLCSSHPQSASCHRIYVASTPLHLVLVTVLDYSVFKAAVKSTKVRLMATVYTR